MIIVEISVHAAVSLQMYMLPYMMVSIFMFTTGKPDIQDLGKYIHYIMISINPIYSCAGFFFMLNRVSMASTNQLC